MAVRWKIHFKSLRTATPYTIYISPSGYTGAASELTGAANPFEIQEDDSDDIFAPVRTSSGYIRIIDEGIDSFDNPFDWHDMVPAGNKDISVELRRDTDSRIEWMGYIKASVYTGRLTGTAPQERSFPVICPFEVLKGETIDPGATSADVVNLAWLLYYATNPVNDDYTGYYIQGDLPVKWMEYEISWQNFYDYDKDGNPETDVTYYNLLENVCLFFGLTARIHRGDVYLVSTVMDSDMSETYDFTFLDNQDMYNLGIGGQHHTEDIVQPDPIDPNGEDFVTAESSESYLQGWHRTEVSNDVNRQNSDIGPDMDAIIETNRGNAITRTTWTEGDTTWTALYLLRQGDAQPTSYTFNARRTSLSLESGLAWMTISYKTDKDWARIHSVDWQCEFHVHGENPQEQHFPDYLFRMRSTVPHHFDHGMIVIGGNVQGSVMIDGTIRTDKIFTVTARLRVGSLTWDPYLQDWGDGNDTFTFTVGAEDYTDETTGSTVVRTYGGKGIDSNRNPLGNYDDYSGFGIPVSSGIGGIVTFEIINITCTHGTNTYYGELAFKDLSLTFARERSFAKYNDLSERKFTSENNSHSSVVKKVGSRIASWNGTAFGLGIIMTPGTQVYADVLTYSQSGHQAPERHLCNIMNAYGSASKRMYVLDLTAASDAGEITPLHLVEYQGKYLYPVSIARNWRDDVVRIKAIEI